MTSQNSDIAVCKVPQYENETKRTWNIMLETTLSKLEKVDIYTQKSLPYKP